MRRLTLTTLLFLGVVGLPRMVMAQASAQPATEVDEESDVRERRLATQLFKDERYEESLQHWLRAYELAPLPRLHYNIAKCYQKLNRPKDELRHMELFSASDPDRSTAPEKHQAAQTRIAELRTQLGLDRKETTPIHKRWWFWTILGTAAAGTAAGIAAAVTVSGGGSAEPAAPGPSVQFETGPAILNVRY